MSWSRLSEAKKKRLIVALTAGALAQGYQLTRHRRASVSELIDTISGEQYLSRA
jgi:hypothetical protein